MTRADWEKSYVSAESALRDAGVENADLLTLEEIRVRFMGRKGELTELLKSLKDLSIEDKRELGPKAQGLPNSVADFEQQIKDAINGKQQ